MCTLFVLSSQYVLFGFSPASARQTPVFSAGALYPGAPWSQFSLCIVPMTVERVCGSGIRLACRVGIPPHARARLLPQASPVVCPACPGEPRSVGDRALQRDGP